MEPSRTFSLAAAGCALALLGLDNAQSQSPLKMTLFGQPSVNNDSIWMAFEKGFYEKEGLDVTYRLFPSGTTAFQSFQSGQGDIVMSGDLPSVQYFFRVKEDYRTIAVSSATPKATSRSPARTSRRRRISPARPLRPASALPAPGSSPNT